MVYISFITDKKGLMRFLELWSYYEFGYDKLLTLLVSLLRGRNNRSKLLAYFVTYNCRCIVIH